MHAMLLPVKNVIAAITPKAIQRAHQIEIQRINAGCYSARNAVIHTLERQ